MNIVYLPAKDILLKLLNVDMLLLHIRDIFCEARGRDIGCKITDTEFMLFEGGYKYINLSCNMNIGSPVRGVGSLVLLDIEERRP